MLSASSTLTATILGALSGLPKHVASMDLQHTRHTRTDAQCSVLAVLSEAGSVERRCSRGVQLKVDVLAAAEHAAEAWEAAVSV